MKFSNLDDWLDWQASLNPAEIELGLGRIRQVLNAMDYTDHFSCPLIMVAGTNGKGSVVAMLDAIASAAGLKVCSYTSPHILSYNERIKINGTVATDEALCQAFEHVDQARDTVPLTYFEFGTLAAIDCFKRATPDLIVMEVGLGGRLDAVNIMQPDVSIITSIDIDHVDWLGDNRELIGREKAGIMRTGLPCICGDRRPPGSVVEIAEALSVQFQCLGRDYEVIVQAESWDLHSDQYSLDALPLPALQGEFQRENAATAIMALAKLPALAINHEAICQGLESVRLKGRFEILRQRPLVVADVAHNQHAVSSLVKHLASSAILGKTRVIIAMLADKPVAEVVECLRPLVDYWYTAGLEREPRGLSAVVMAAVVEQSLNSEVLSDSMLDPTQSDVKLHPVSTVEAAIDAALSDAAEDDRIIILGSFYTVAAAIQYFS